MVPRHPQAFGDSVNGATISTAVDLASTAAGEGHGVGRGEVGVAPRLRHDRSSLEDSRTGDEEFASCVGEALGGSSDVSDGGESPGEET